MKLIARAGEINSDTARGLQELADQYDYENLNRLLEKEDAGNS